MSNPYSDMAKVFSQTGNSAQMRFGIIASVSPLAVNVGGLSISGENLFINQELLPETKKAEISLPGSQITEPDGNIVFSEPLKSGDRVLLYSEDDQVFYILLKVVHT